MTFVWTTRKDRFEGEFLGIPLRSGLCGRLGKQGRSVGSPHTHTPMIKHFKRKYWGPVNGTGCMISFQESLELEWFQLLPGATKQPPASGAWQLSAAPRQGWRQSWQQIINLLRFYLPATLSVMPTLLSDLNVHSPPKHLVPFLNCTPISSSRGTNCLLTNYRYVLTYTLPVTGS